MKGKIIPIAASNGRQSTLKLIWKIAMDVDRFFRKKKRDYYLFIYFFIMNISSTLYTISLNEWKYMLFLIKVEIHPYKIKW